MTDQRFFSDGFPYTPQDASHSPDDINRIIHSENILPPECLHGEYHTDPDTMEQVLSRAVYYPGEMNLLATVAHHRLRYVFAAFNEEFTGVASEVASWDVLRAVSSLYGHSPDPGEIEILIRRITDGGTISIESHTVVDFWTDHIVGALDNPDRDKIEQLVADSLARAGQRHGDTLSTGGTLARQWHDAAGERVPKAVVNDVRLILAENIKVCDSTKSGSSHTMPGMDSLLWRDWSSRKTPLDGLSELSHIIAPEDGY